MRIVFFGLGSIGRRHARLIQEYWPGHELYAFRQKYPVSSCEGVQDIIYDYDVLNLKADIAFITNPTDMHIETALKCAKKGMHLFIEKPISNSLSGLWELQREVKKRNLATYVAYPLRCHKPFNPPWLDAKSFVCRSNSRKWPSKRKLDNVVLEMSHEIDLAEWLNGQIQYIDGDINRGGTIALLNLYHKGGKVTKVTLNMVSDEEERYLIKDDGERLDIMIDDKFYISQLRRFFNKRYTPYLENSLAEASNLFARIIEFKERL
jgi:predicted dehydrogenase